MSYFGNKRQEVENIYKSLNFDGITTIIEPFCGSCAMSYYISLQKPKALKYILNDNNKYLKEMYEILKDDTKCLEFETLYNKTLENIDTKEKYLDAIKNDTLLCWLIKNKYYTIRPGLYPFSRTKKTLLKFSDCPIYNFFRDENIEFTCLNGFDVYKQYATDSKNLILLDPPYLSACNDYYNDPTVQIYEYFSRNSIMKEKSKIYIILASNWIISLLMKDYNNLMEYDKKYSGFKSKATIHTIYSNQLKQK
jgi:site-specific DNA-adenine methylase